MQTLVLIIILIFCQLAYSSEGPCPPGKIRVRSFPRSEYIKDDGTYYSSSIVTSFCKSKNKTTKFWADQFNDNRVKDWPKKNNTEKFKQWNQKEIEMVLSALEKVSEFMWRKVNLHRADTSADHKDNPATSAEAVLVLYDNLFVKPELMPRVLTHELAHQVFRDLRSVEQADYRQVGEWTKVGESNGEPVFKSRRKRFVEPDGDLSPGEDFANNLEYFIFNPQILKIKNPAIFDWMTIQYGDKIK